MPDERDRDKDRGGASPSRPAPTTPGMAGANPVKLPPAPTPPSGPAPRREGPGGRVATPTSPPAPVDPAVIAAATAAAVAAVARHSAATASTPDMDKTVPGGVYIVDGQVMDANRNLRELPQDEGGDAEDADSGAPARET